ncbi:chain length determinant protein [Streptomyces sp. NBC_01476]|uniref:chain length determinant protein n=1 Tax=Streptomyces sp. NBC_01476 TaxID=2903881 RepID=UPI002E3289F4|nr:chain length determinant protein [Streptomyces sp. NBC_01476]
MDLAEIYRVMRRRWYVLLPGLVLTAALTIGAYVKVPVTYQSQSTVVLLNSQKATVAFNGNPFLSTQLSLNGMADSLARNLNSDAALAHLKSQGAHSTTVAKIADNALGPLMWLTATGNDKRDVLASDRLLTSYAAERLEEFQTDQSVPDDAMIRMATIVPPQNPVAQTKTRYEYLVAAGLLGIVVSMVATFYAEARSRTGARSRPPEGRHAADPADEAGGGASTPGSGPDSASVDGTAAAAGTGKPPAARHTPRWSMSGARDTDLPSDPSPSGPAGRVTADTLPAGTEATDTEAHRFV